MENLYKTHPQIKPNFTSEDIELLKEYFEFNKKYHSRIDDDITLRLSDHPLWAPFLKEQSRGQRLEQNARAHVLQRAAIYDGYWEAYTEDLITQGIAYARMNIKYADWYEIIKMYKDCLIPYIKNDYPDNTDKAINILDGLGKLIDFAMYGIAEAYFYEKNLVIEEMNIQLTKKGTE